MRVSVDASEVEELAWLVKDNLYTKHLVLSAEELFVEFLQPDYVGEGSLELEPMLSYQRMLLHRLADCFGLVHESVGEGDNRRIVIEKCEDSKTPLMLVSDVLESCYGEVHHAPANRQLLLRAPNGTGDQTNHPSVQSPALSLEEREAAYQAARERIFSDRASVSPESSSEQRETQRARPVPAVARRMIAHALGKPQVLTAEFPPNEVIGTSLEDVPASEAPKEAPRHSPAKAARRMLTQALGFPVSSPSSRDPERRVMIKQSHSITIEAGLRPSSEIDVASSATEIPLNGFIPLEIDEGLRFRDAAVKDVHSVDHSGASQQSSGATSARSLRKDRPGAAAGRMFAQALGLPHSSNSGSVADSSAKSMRNRSKGGKELPINSNNVSMYIGDDSNSFLDESVHLLGSVTSRALEEREKPKSLDRSKVEVVLQEDLRKGGSRRGHKLESSLLRSKNHVFQEDQETGELFLTSSQIIRNGSQNNRLKDIM